MNSPLNHPIHLHLSIFFAVTIHQSIVKLSKFAITTHSTHFHSKLDWISCVAQRYYFIRTTFGRHDVTHSRFACMNCVDVYVWMPSSQIWPNRLYVLVRAIKWFARSYAHLLLFWFLEEREQATTLFGLWSGSYFKWIALIEVSSFLWP